MNSKDKKIICKRIFFIIFAIILLSIIVIYNFTFAKSNSYDTKQTYSLDNVKISNAKEINIDEKLIFLFHVEQELERVFCRKDNEKVYLRVSDQNRELDRDRVRKLEYDKMIRRFEEEVISEFDTDDLDEQLLLAYQEKLN